ncbi:polysaccharide pyruvyl transferase family protein [Microbacterium sp. JZ70]
MPVRTFYWDPAVRGWRGVLRRPSFRVGNAGDLLNRDLIRHFYGEEPHNTEDGSRLLLVGSVIHRMQPGDVVAGVGTKGSPLPAPDTLGDVEIRGVRGPITYDALNRAGFDVSHVSFQADPGLLVRELYPAEAEKEAVRGRVTFIPHYRDREEYRRTPGVRIVDIDCEPSQLAAEIAQAEVVLTSSLHGLIFAHAIGRPVVLVAPIRSEPMIKYQDYMASVGLAWREPVDLASALASPLPSSPVDIDFDPESITFPDLDTLVARGLTEPR